MKIQTVEFPKTPDETLAKVEEFRPLLDEFFQETAGKTSEFLQAEMLVMAWHSAMLDFIEVVENGERVGLMMINLSFHPTELERFGLISLAYVKPTHRKQGVFRKMLDYARLIYRARQVKYLELAVKVDQEINSFGRVVSQIYREDLM